MMKFSEWKPGKVIAYERAMQKKKGGVAWHIKRRRGQQTYMMKVLTSSY